MVDISRRHNPAHHADSRGMAGLALVGKTQTSARRRGNGTEGEVSMNPEGKHLTS